MNTEELKRPIAWNVMNARGEWLACSEADYENYLSRGIKVRARYRPEPVMELIRQRDELLAALKDARRELAYAGRQEAHDAANAAIAKAEG